MLPQSRARGDLHLSRGSLRPGQRLFLPWRCRLGEARSQRRLCFPFEGRSTVSSGFPHGGRIGRTGIQTQACDGAHQWQATDVEQNSSTADVPSATTTKRRPGIQRTTCRIICHAPFVMVVCRLLRSSGERSEGAHTRQAHGLGVQSIRYIQRKPGVFANNPWLERTRSRETPRAAIVRPRRRSIISSMPRITGSFAGTPGCTSTTSKRRLSSRLDHFTRLRTRWSF